MANVSTTKTIVTVNPTTTKTVVNVNQNTGPKGDTGAAPDTSTLITGTKVSSTNQTVSGKFSVSQSSSDHALQTTLSGTASDTTALNVVSTNPNSSAVWITGTETGWGTLKVAHKQTATGAASNDANAAAISINLASDDTRGAGGDITAAQGIFIDTYQPSNNSIKYGTSGKLLNIRNAGNDRLVLTSSGQLQLANQGSTAGITMGTDTQIYRASAGIIRSDNYIYLGKTSGVNLFTSTLSGASSTNASFALNADGKLEWGSGSQTAPNNTRDTNLYRSAAAELKTDGQLTATTLKGSNTVSGTDVDATNKIADAYSQMLYNTRSSNVSTIHRTFINNSSTVLTGYNLAGRASVLVSGTYDKIRGKFSSGGTNVSDAKFCVWNASGNLVAYTSNLVNQNGGTSTTVSTTLYDNWPLTITAAGGGGSSLSLNAGDFVWLGIICYATTTGPTIVSYYSGNGTNTAIIGSALTIKTTGSITGPALSVYNSAGWTGGIPSASLGSTAGSNIPWIELIGT